MRRQFARDLRSLFDRHFLFLYLYNVLVIATAVVCLIAKFFGWPHRVSFTWLRILGKVILDCLREQPRYGAA